MRIAGGLTAPLVRPFDVLLVALVVAVAARMTLTVRVGSSRLTQSLTDTAILLGLMLLPWPWLMLAVAPSVAVAKLLSHMPPKHVVMSVAKDVLTVRLAGAVGVLVGLGSPFQPTLGDVPGLLVVAVAIIVIDEALSIPMLALMIDQPVRDVFRRDLGFRLGGSAARLLVAITAGYLLRFDPRMAIVTPLLLLGVHLAYANRLQQRADQLAWQRLARIADALGASHEYAVRRAAVLGAAELFCCDEVDLEINSLIDGPSLMRGTSSAITYVGVPEKAPRARGMVVASALESHGVWHPTPGELRLRFFTPVTFSEREHYTLRALASALGTALRKTGAVAEAARMAVFQAHAATHDDLTKLANRRNLLEFGARRKAAARRGDTDETELLGLIVLDLKAFRQINEALDRSIGDEVLVAVARRLTVAAEEMARADTVTHPGATAIAARIGGDEFALLLTGLPMAGDALVRARSLTSKLAEPIEIGGLRLEIGARAGVAVGGGLVSVDELLRRADVAMNQAKDENQPIALYVHDRDTADADRLSLSADLARAVSEREFVIAFQPIVDLASGQVISMEALARWYHPQRGHLAPLRFLGAIERSGLLAPFTAHVLDQSLAGARAWRDAGFDLPVAVNVSPRSLLDPSFPDSIPAALAVHGLPPEALTIELTETLTLSQLEVVDDVLHAIRDLGVSLALDDFGTGFSSLATIARIPVHELKIDRTFVAGMTGTTESAIVRSTIELGRSLDLLVVAEGIENDEQRERLWSLGCPAGQGHLFARPMSATQLIARLERGHEGVPGRLVAPLHASGDVIRLAATRRAGATRSVKPASTKPAAPKPAAAKPASARSVKTPTTAPSAETQPTTAESTKAPLTTSEVTPAESAKPKSTKAQPSRSQPVPRKLAANVRPAKTQPSGTRSTAAGSAAAQLAAPPVPATEPAAPEPKRRTRSGTTDSRTASTE